MEEVKNVPNIKKVTVELENGKKLEFDKQFILFAEDEMSNTEKTVHGDAHGKICGVVSCKANFMASVASSMLKTMHDKMPGLDRTVIMEHLLETDDVAKMLADVLG